VSAWIGVDPGARYTGIVAVEDRKVAACVVIDRDHYPDHYLDQIEQRVRVALAALSPSVQVAIEDVNAPSPHMGIARPADLITLGRTVGYLQRAFPDALLIPPNKHGSHPWGTYPPELLTAREKVNAKAKPLAVAGQSSTMRHARSAYDIALAASLNARLEASLRGPRQ
jgi:hypothetical protein